MRLTPASKESVGERENATSFKASELWHLKMLTFSTKNL